MEKRAGFEWVDDGCHRTLPEPKPRSPEGTRTVTRRTDQGLTSTSLSRLLMPSRAWFIEGLICNNLSERLVLDGIIYSGDWIGLGKRIVICLWDASSLFELSCDSTTWFK